MKKNKQKAFTLLELLVVIAMIGILISLGVASFSNAQRKARDSRRREDLKSWQNGIEQYYAVNTNYRITNATSNAWTLSTWYSNLTDGNQFFPAGAPVDPKNFGDQRYRNYYSQSAYCVCVRLETPGTGNATSFPSSVTCNYGVGGDYFCVSNLQ